jgi:glycosyltransferase involved in cell wall biosynthesis
VKDILIITSYFPPEIGAASNRIFQLVEGLQKNDYRVTVLTPLPNYPKGQIFEEYKGHFKKTSIENNITIHRLWISANNSKNPFLRLIAMLSYSFSLIWFFMWNTIPKKVIIQSPPLLVAFTSLFFLRTKKRKLILNVSDLWPKAGLELGVFKKNFSYKLLEYIERYNYKAADLILGQSEEILTHIKSILPKKNTFLYRNYPDFESQDMGFYVPSEGKIKLVYAGLLGVAQGIYKLIQNLDYTNLEFHIYGAGSEQEQIEKFILQHPNLPILYHGELNRKVLQQELLKYDVAIIPLLNRIYGSVPSKIFEYARLGLPMIYFGGGEGEELVLQNGLGWVAESRNYKELNNVISKIKKVDLNLKFRESIKSTSRLKFDFKEQLQKLVKTI